MKQRKSVVRIGCSSGFWGDSLSAAHQLVKQDDHPIDYLVCDYLAEVTMCILAKGKKKPSGGMGPGGYIAEFVKFLWQPLMKDIVRKNIKIVTNAGGLNPVGLKEAIENASRAAGQPVPVVAAVTGDDLVDSLANHAFQPFSLLDKAESLWDAGDKLESCNAYLGAKPIFDALERGAQIVVTGRGADSAIVLGPLMHEFGWSLSDYDLLAAGSCIGHIIECGCHATGGNFTDWRDSLAAGWTNVGYPIAECYADGTAVITKPDNTGGIVTRGTVSEQLLYEIGDPSAYVLPDVVVDFRQLRLKEVGPNRVLVQGAKGYRSTPWYKVSATKYEGFQLSANLVLGGLDAVEKGFATASNILQRSSGLLAVRKMAPFSDTRIEILGGEATYGPNANPELLKNQREVVIRLSAKHPELVGLAVLAKEIAPAALSMAPGLMGTAGGRVQPTANMKLFSALVPKAQIKISVTLGTEEPFQSHPDLPTLASAPVALPATPCLEISSTRPRLLRDICWGRSGDKGDSANIGLICRDPADYRALLTVVTSEYVQSMMGHLIKGEVARYELPGLSAINFVCTYALGGGGAGSINADRQGKAFAQQLLSYSVPWPFPAKL